MEITVYNGQRKTRFDLAWLRGFAKEALVQALAHPATPETVLAGLAEVTVRVVSDAEIARLHVDFMGIAGPTDVITFEEGDIVVSAQTALANAAHYGKSLEEELALYIMHGLLHLSGYDDRAPRQARRMHRLQEQLAGAACRVLKKPAKRNPSRRASRRARL